MTLPKSIRPVFFFTLGYVALFALFAAVTSNIEFLFYVLIVIVVFMLLLRYHESFNLSRSTLWLLSVWGLMHMLGGTLPINGSVLYNLWLIPNIFKYDQLVHLYGFAAATILCYELIAPMITVARKGRFLFLLVMMGLGLGALNEIIEFVAVLSIPETNVGGYENTAWDLVFDLFGAVLAAAYIAKKKLV